MSSTGGTTQGGRGLQFPVESERQSIVDIEEDTNNDHENTYLNINDRENTCVDIEEASINDHESTCLAIEEDSINDHENTYLDIEEDSIDEGENRSQNRIESLYAKFESTRLSVDSKSNVGSPSTGNSTAYSDTEEDNNNINLGIEEDNSINDLENQSQFRIDSWNAQFESARQSIDSTGNSTNLDIEIEEDNNSINDQDNQSQIRIDSRNAKVEWMFRIGNLVLEIVSAIFDQLSSANNSRYALIGMLITYAAIVIGIIELIYKWRKEKVSWRWKKILPWFYSPLPSDWPYTFMDIIGFICALGQSIVTTINYFDANKHINLCVWPIIFTSGLLCSKLGRISPTDQRARI